MKKDSLNNCEVINEKLIEQKNTLIKKNKDLELQAKLDKLNRFRQLINYIDEGIIVVELPSGKIVDANHTSCNLFGLTEKTILSMNINEIAGKFNPPDHLKNLINNSVNTNINTVGTNLIKSDNSTVPVEISVKSATYEDQKFFILSIRDIEDKVITEQKLVMAKEEAEKSNYLKTEFLAQISHEIRTPLNSILNFIALMKEELEGKVSEDLKSCFKIIDNGSKRIIRTVDLILDMSQIQSGNYEANYKKLDLAKDVLENLVLDFYLLSKGKNVTLQFNNHCKTAAIFADPYSVSQIFFNLIENAIKYTYEGNIEINIYEKTNKIIVDVKDTGIGISSEYLSNIFTPFTQEEIGYTRKFEGTGLGLALVKRYVELNKAEIKVESIKGKGSIFTIIFDKYEN